MNVDKQKRIMSATFVVENTIDQIPYRNTFRIVWLSIVKEWVANVTILCLRVALFTM
jgi:hypothetical protein